MRSKRQGAVRPAGKSSSLVCRLLVPIPVTNSCPCRSLSIKDPSLKIEVLSSMFTETDEMIEDVRISDHAPVKSASQEAREDPAIRSFEVLHANGRSVVQRWTRPVCTIMGAFRKAGMLPNYPFRIEDGHYNILVTGSRDSITRLYRTLAETVSGTVIESVRPSSMYKGKDLFTGHQLDIFHAALALGYWDVPRRARGTEMASLFHVSNSTMAETLALIESKVVREIEKHYFDQA